MKKALIVFFILFSIQFFGQQETPFEYYDKNFTETINKTEIAFISFAEFDNNIKSNNLIYYDLSGNVRKYERYSDLQRRILHGVTEELYENGIVLSQTNYKINKIDGKLVRFWPEGNLKREETYSEGNFLNGKCYDANNTEVEYYPLNSPPVYSEGNDAFTTYLSKNIKGNAINSIGKIVVRFTINANGDLTEIKFLRDTNDQKLNERIITVLSNSAKWIPARFDGVAVESYVTLPINVITNNSKSAKLETFESQILRF